MAPAPARWRCSCWDPRSSKVRRYTIVDLSGTLRARQQQALAGFGDTVRWVDALPEAIQGVVVGNEVLDAMPVKLLARVDGVWLERGVTFGGAQLMFSDRPPTCVHHWRWTARTTT